MYVCMYVRTYCIAGIFRGAKMFMVVRTSNTTVIVHRFKFRAAYENILYVYRMLIDGNCCERDVC